MSKSKKHYENPNLTVAKKIIEIIKSKDLKEWKEGWDPTKSGAFKNPKTNILYRGLNFIALYAQTMLKGYKDNRWLTYKQAQSLGGSIKSGEKATLLVFYTEWDKKAKKYFKLENISSLSQEEQDKYIKENVVTISKPFYVFNVEQCKDLKLKPEKYLTKKEMKEKSNSICEKIIKNSEAKIYEDGKNTAFYNSKNDTIHVPEKKIFNSMEDYYATILHEIGHSTASDKRLKRDLTGEFGSQKYAKEELIAEFISIMIQNQAEIKLEGNHFNNHASYIKNWMDNTKDSDKPYDILNIISLADKGCKYIVENMLNKKVKENNQLQTTTKQTIR